VRKSVLVMFSAIVVGMMLATPVSAGTVTIRVTDRQGDIGKLADYVTCDLKNGWGDNAPIVKAGYFDMLSYWLSYSSKDKAYSFGMELAASLPTEGSPLPPGMKSVCWLMWIDPEPWNPAYGYNAPWLYAIALTYDGATYGAVLMETGYNVVGSLSFEVAGSAFEVQFSATSIGHLSSFWWFPCPMTVWSPSGMVWDVDGPDPGAAPGQVWWDIPWPPV
jgi:hypothetical protein